MESHTLMREIVVLWIVQIPYYAVDIILLRVFNTLLQHLYGVL